MMRSPLPRTDWKQGGRGHRGFGGHRHQQRSTEMPVTSGLVSSPIGHIYTDEVKRNAGSGLSLAEPHIVGSYNWLNRIKPTVSIPGGPPVWQNDVELGDVPADSPTQDIHKNAVQLRASKTSSLDVLFQAVTISSPGFQLSDMDVISDRNNLRKLASLFVEDDEKGEERFDSFRIGVEVAGKTLLLTRWETAIERGNYKSFSQNYMEAMTRPGDRSQAGATSSYAVSHAGLGDLNVLIRFEVDATLNKLDKPADKATTDTKAASGSEASNSDADDLADLLGGVKLSGDGKKTSVAAAAQKPYEVIQAGQLPVLEDLVEIKTRSMRNPYDKADMKYQAIWSGPTSVYVGRHLFGDFGVMPVEKHRFGESLEKNSGVPVVMAQVAALLKQIKAEVLKSVGSGIQVAIVKEAGRGNSTLKLFRYIDEAGLDQISAEMRDRVNASTASIDPSQGGDDAVEEKSC